MSNALHNASAGIGGLVTHGWQRIDIHAVSLRWVFMVNVVIVVMISSMMDSSTLHVGIKVMGVMQGRMFSAFVRLLRQPLLVLALLHDFVEPQATWLRVI